MNFKHRLEAWVELIGRYIRVSQFWWHKKNEITPPVLYAHEAEFLPSALALQHKPVSPTARWVARLLILLLTLLLLWSIFGYIDITVDAQGKIIPDGQTKVITAVQVATVRTILVVDGQQVKAGQVLIELDSRALENEHAKDLGDWQMATLQGARSSALISSLRSRQQPKMPKVTGVSHGLWEEAATHLQGQWGDFVAKRDRLNADIGRWSAALPLARNIAEDYAALAETNDVARTDALAKKQAEVDLQGQLDAARMQLAALIAETRKNAEDDLAQATKEAADAKADAAKIQTEINQLVLRSPVTGTVQQLQVHTIGAAVPAAQALMQIVPQNTSVTVEAMLADKDVGFIHVGQSAEVKIDAFDYTKYGTVPARVSVVSRDAVEDQKKGLQYAVRVTLLNPILNVDGMKRSLDPGMSGTVEIRTGRRQVIEYFLSPLIRHTTESLHER